VRVDASEPLSPRSVGREASSGKIQVGWKRSLHLRFMRSTKAVVGVSGRSFGRANAAQFRDAGGTAWQPDDYRWARFTGL
jgi:hypothetical protein